MAEVHEHEYKIVVNGREKSVMSQVLTFDEVVALAFDPVPTGPEVFFTIAYRHAKSEPHDGTLTDSETVEVKDGTIFDVTQTDKS